MHSPSGHTPLTSSLVLRYALPTFTVYFLYGPLTILQGMYAKYFGLALTTIASVILIARLFDAIIDPVIGYCADYYFARSGSRKHFVIVGGFLFIISGWFLYVPPSGVSAGYFLSWFLVFYLAYTLFEIPHLAWGSELAVDAGEKNKVYALRAFCSQLGMLCFYAMPLLPIFETSDIKPQTLKWSVGLAAVIMLPMLYLSIKSVPDTRSRRQHPSHEQQAKKQNWSTVYRTVVVNRPLLILLSALSFEALGMGMWSILLFLFADAYLGLGGQFSLTYVISSGFTILSLKLWYQLANRWGKQRSWVAGMVLMTIGLLGTGMLSPGHSWLLLLLCMIVIMTGLGVLTTSISLLSDIIDYSTWKFGSDRTASYFALFLLVSKTLGALGGALGFALAGWYGFDPSVTVHSDKAIFGLRLSIAWIPTLLIIFSIIFIARIPITAAQHAVIRRRLDVQVSRTNSAES